MQIETRRPKVMATHHSLNFVKVKFKYTTRKPIFSFIFNGNNNVYPVTISEIFANEMCTTLILTFRTNQRQMCTCHSKAYMQLSICCQLQFYPQSVTVSETFRVNTCMTLTLTNVPSSNDMSIERPYATLYLLPIGKFVLSVTV